MTVNCDQQQQAQSKGRQDSNLTTTGSLGGSEYVATRKLSIVGRSYAVQSPIVPSIALSATTSLDQSYEDPTFSQGITTRLICL